MDSFIEALYGRSEETIPEEYDWFAPLLGDWEFDYKDKFIDGDRSRPQRQLKGGNPEHPCLKMFAAQALII